MPSSIAITRWCKVSCWSRQQSTSCSICSPTSLMCSSIRGCAPDMADITVNLRLAATKDAPETPLRRAMRRLFRRKSAGFGLIIVAFFVALAVFAPLLTPYDPTAQSWTLVRHPPSASHWFGTDDLGRDILVRVIYGARASLMAGGISVGIALSIGVPLGLAGGYLGGFL